MTRPLVILGTSRSDGDTRRSVDAAFGSRADYLDLNSYALGPYDYNHANQNDGFAGIIDAVLVADTLIFATPVYWYSMSALLKTFFDRLSDLITIEKAKGRALAGKKAWLIATGIEEYLPDGFEVPFARTCKYFDIRYLGAGYLYTGADPRLRDESETRIRVFGSVVTGSNQKGA
jgi:NADPH-dependent FMN reductase